MDILDNFCFAKYDGINEIEDEKKYAADVELDVSKNWHNNRPIDNGTIICPFYTLEINGINVPVYGTRTATGIHSFARVFVNKESGLNLSVKITAKEKGTALKSAKSCVVLPLKNGVKAKTENATIFAIIEKLGNYSFAIDGKPAQALTIMVQKQIGIELFGQKKTKFIEPKDYSFSDKVEELVFKEENTIYFFKKGRYKIEKIRVPSNCVVYFESGVYIEVMPSVYDPEDKFGNYFILAIDKNNVGFYGDAVFDYSACCGGETYDENLKNNKRGVRFIGCENVTVSGITFINSQNWTCCFLNCKNVSVKDNMLLAYRVFSDGIMLSECKDSVVEYNFVRTGDDGLEVKSVSEEGLTDNVLFTRNSCWSDKGDAYGSIYECVHDTRNVWFKDNSVGFALGTWSRHLGCCIIQMGQFKGRTVENIHFEDMEIYENHNKGAISLYADIHCGIYRGYGTIKNIYFKNINVIKNFGSVIHLSTGEGEDSKIGDVYFDNVCSNGKVVDRSMLTDSKILLDEVENGYDINKIHIKQVEKQ